MIWILLTVLFGVVAWIWYRLHNDESGAISCCGCGKCAVSGECVMVKKKRAEKPKNCP